MVTVIMMTIEIAILMLLLTVMTMYSVNKALSRRYQASCTLRGNNILYLGEKCASGVERENTGIEIETKYWKW